MVGVLGLELGGRRFVGRRRIRFDFRGGCVGSPRKKYQPFDNYFEFRPLLPVARFPAVLLKASLEKGRAPLPKVIARHFRRAAVSGAVDEGYLLRQFAVAVAVLAVDG